MPTFYIRITRILYVHITSGFELILHVLRVERFSPLKVNANYNYMQIVVETLNF